MSAIEKGTGCSPRRRSRLDVDTWLPSSRLQPLMFELDAEIMTPQQLESASQRRPIVPSATHHKCAITITATKPENSNTLEWLRYLHEGTNMRLVTKRPLIQRRSTSTAAASLYPPTPFAAQSRYRNTFISRTTASQPALSAHWQKKVDARRCANPCANFPINAHKLR